jgi:hypothetical protein
MGKEAVKRNSVSFARVVNSVFLRIVYPLNIKDTAACPMLRADHAVAMAGINIVM